MVDGYYQYRFNTGAPNLPNSMRSFDVENNSFQVNFGKLVVQTQTAPAGFRLDLAFGPAADLTSGDCPIGSAGCLKGISEVTKMFEQAYVTFALPSKITLDFGKFTTWAGAEVIEAKDNWLYSRSMLFTNGPFTHTGIRAQMQVTDALVLKLGVLNGWEVVTDNNPQKSFAAAVGYTIPGANTGITFTTYQGVEESADVGTGLNAVGLNGGTSLPWRQYYDLVVAQPLGDKLSLNLNVAAQLQEEIKKHWWGASLMAQYIAMPSLKIAARYEYFSDMDGAQSGTGKETSINAATLAFIFPVGSNGEVRLEGRGDFSSVGFYGPAASTSQVTATAAALAWF